MGNKKICVYWRTPGGDWMQTTGIPKSTVREALKEFSQNNNIGWEKMKEGIEYDGQNEEDVTWGMGAEKYIAEPPCIIADFKTKTIYEKRAPLLLPNPPKGWTHTTDLKDVKERGVLSESAVNTIERWQKSK